MRLTGLEPAHREILDPKSSASTNSATGARKVLRSVGRFAGAKVLLLRETTKFFKEKNIESTLKKHKHAKYSEKSMQSYSHHL